MIYDPLARLMGDWSVEINFYTILLRIGLSVFLAAIIGCERSVKRHSAGLRTFILVSFASTVARRISCKLERYKILPSVCGIGNCRFDNQRKFHAVQLA